MVVVRLQASWACYLLRSKHLNLLVRCRPIAERDIKGAGAVRQTGIHCELLCFRTSKGQTSSHVLKLRSSKHCMRSCLT